MTLFKEIKVGKGYVEAICFKLLKRNLIVIRGKRGYIMCGYLDMSVSTKFKEPAAKIIGVSTIKEALMASIFSCTLSAKKLGIYEGQKVKDALKIIV